MSDMSPFAFTHEFVIAHLDGADFRDRDVDSCYDALLAFERHIRRLWSHQLRRRAKTVPDGVRCCVVRA